MYSKKFDGHEKAQAQELHYNDGSIALQSYSTIVAEINPEGWLMVNGLYSMTTIKHIGWFMKKWSLTYQLAKQLYNDDKMFNIFTGEIKDRGWH